MMSESAADQVRIEQDLAQTRSRMDGRLSELQGRLSPGQIIDDLMGYFRGSEGGDFARNLMDSVRSNPLPAALTGIGLTWLMASNPHPDHDLAASKDGNGKVRAVRAVGNHAWTSHEEIDRTFNGVEQGVVRQNNEPEEIYRARLHEARGTALGITRQPQDTPATFGTRVQEALAAAKQSVTDSAYDLRARTGDGAERLSGVARNAGSSIINGGQAAQLTGRSLLSTFSDNPVLLGALGLAVGALLGALVPQSEHEQAALGGMAGQAREAARGLERDRLTLKRSLHVGGNCCIRRG